MAIAIPSLVVAASARRGGGSGTGSRFWYVAGVTAVVAKVLSPCTMRSARHRRSGANSLTRLSQCLTEAAAHMLGASVYPRLFQYSFCWLLLLLCHTNALLLPVYSFFREKKERICSAAIGHSSDTTSNRDKVCKRSCLPARLTVSQSVRQATHASVESGREHGKKTAKLPDIDTGRRLPSSKTQQKTRPLQTNERRLRGICSEPNEGSATHT